MAEAVTLTLPDHLVRQAQATARLTGYSAEAVLVEWIIQGAAHDASILLRPGVEYPIYTPYGNEAVAAIMLNALESDSVDDTIDADDLCTHDPGAR
ncbi:MAG: hypothetical protein M3Z04_06015 [Chloroflexota bacterium]|nr:hypothetical protein [Chloroflexota bacterium]